MYRDVAWEGIGYPRTHVTSEAIVGLWWQFLSPTSRGHIHYLPGKDQSSTDNDNNCVG